MPGMSSSNIFGSYNIVVQAQGDGITVNVNQPHLTLTAWHLNAPKAQKILDLLTPFCRAIPLVGRDSAKRDLEDWLDGESAISVRCLIGGAGSGKTRLAIEVCLAAAAKGWDVGFVAHQELVRFRNQQNLSAWGWSRNTLIVVDYAAAKAKLLREWLVELSRNRDGRGYRLRLLMLERHADAKLGWWHDLISPGTFSEDSVGDLFNPSEPFVLTALAGSQECREILSRVMAETSRILGKPQILRPPAPGENPEFDRKLADPSVAFAPLYLKHGGRDCRPRRSAELAQARSR
jgi:hypothetical protein